MKKFIYFVFVLAGSLLQASEDRFCGVFGRTENRSYTPCPTLKRIGQEPLREIESNSPPPQGCQPPPSSGAGLSKDGRRSVAGIIGRRRGFIDPPVGVMGSEQRKYLAEVHRQNVKRHNASRVECDCDGNVTGKPCEVDGQKIVTAVADAIQEAKKQGQFDWAERLHNLVTERKLNGQFSSLQDQREGLERFHQAHKKRKADDRQELCDQEEDHRFSIQQDYDCGVEKIVARGNPAIDSSFMPPPEMPNPLAQAEEELFFQRVVRASSGIEPHLPVDCVQQRRRDRPTGVGAQWGCDTNIVRRKKTAVQRHDSEEPWQVAMREAEEEQEKEHRAFLHTHIATITNRGRLPVVDSNGQVVQDYKGTRLSDEEMKAVREEFLERCAAMEKARIDFLKRCGVIGEDEDLEV